MLVLAPVQYKKKFLSYEQFPSLYSICVAGIVFLKTSLSLSRALAFAPKPLHVAAVEHSDDYLAVFYCVLLFSIRA